MLKIRTILGIACVVASVAVAQDGVVMGVVGISRVSIPPAGGVNLVGFNFTSDTPLYLEDVFGTNQLASSTRSRNADKIYLWNGSSYDSFYQKPDGLFYDVLSGQQATAEISHGTALFLQSASSATETNQIFLSGAVLLEDSAPQAYQGSLSTMANPYPTDLDLNDVSLDWSMATANNRSRNADKVYIWNADTSAYDAFYLDGNRIWQQLVSSIPDPIIPAGGGAFYDAQVAFTNDIFKLFD